TTKKALYTDKVVVTYSSISTNAFEKYGECVMGSRGTLVVEEETTAMLWPAAGRATQATMTTTAPGQAAGDTTSSSPPGADLALQRGQQSVGSGNSVSRGYREEMEHMAYCIRMLDQGMAAHHESLKLQCDGTAAMPDA